MNRTVTLFRCADLRMRLRFAFAPHFARMNATVSSRECPKTGRQTQLGFGPVFRVKKDLPVSVPDPIVFEPFPFALPFAELLSSPSCFFHRHSDPSQLCPGIVASITSESQARFLQSAQDASRNLKCPARENFRSSEFRRDPLFPFQVRNIRKPQLQLADALIAYYLK